eukprot:TRINITY_DN6321_c0_g1_i1.p1 TRINITY_DN6321_c0_g1~~TRINITY_DN6321_c0_g1_i1.p1  ORF type:complete len:174 (-),score=39.08 TRINITY_DN6321_c0_g1_i1:682-1203(-)
MGNQVCCRDENSSQAWCIDDINDARCEAVESKRVRPAPDLLIEEGRLPEKLVQPAKSLQLVPVQMVHSREKALSKEPRNKEFKVALDRTDSALLGCDVDRQDGQTLVLAAITGVGLVTRWNEVNPGNALRPGDRIVEVNGVRGDAAQLLDECRKPQVLRMLVQRDDDDERVDT